jgi:hypothetical protein
MDNRTAGEGEGEGKKIEAKPFIPVPHVPHSTNVAPLPAGKVIVGHRITIQGYYLAAPRPAKVAPFDRIEKRRVGYFETFDLSFSEHRVHGIGALGHILSDALLAKRLSAKDPEFRAIYTHHVVKHENLLADAPVASQPEPEPEQ